MTIFVDLNNHIKAMIEQLEKMKRMVITMIELAKKQPDEEEQINSLLDLLNQINEQIKKANQQS
jgi:flagellar hook-associated protein FlgK